MMDFNNNLLLYNLEQLKDMLEIQEFLCGTGDDELKIVIKKKESKFGEMIKSKKKLKIKKQDLLNIVEGVISEKTNTIQRIKEK